jgi:hypothetical protein
MAKPDRVDSSVPRGKAAFHALVVAAAFLVDQAAPPTGKVLVALTGLAMAASILGGPRWSLFGRLFGGVVRPALRIRPGTLESAAPHRFAEAVGACFLLAASLAFLLGAAALGWALALLVVALAALNWLAGICVGCQMYVLGRRLGGRARHDVGA